MNVLMFTNTYLPHVGGVAMSVHRFAEGLRARGNTVRVVAPCYEGSARVEPDIFRVPAVRNFNGSGFSVPLPASGRISPSTRGFVPDVVHSHHPYLLGNTALRYAAYYGAPIVFTHHTLYEQYTHYIPGDSTFLKRFVVTLAVSYCNLCTSVIAPSASVASLLRYRGVRTPVTVIPTGVEAGYLYREEGVGLRKRYGIPEDAFVIGHVGRLAREKNIEFLTLALSHYLRANPGDRVLVAGVGPMEGYMRKIFALHGISRQVHLLGILEGEDLHRAYRAMDAFAFTSMSETQGLVLLEAMASGVPVIAIDSPGVRDVVRDKLNGRLIEGTDLMGFVNALTWVRSLEHEGRRKIRDEIGRTVSGFTMEKAINSLLSLYSLALEGTRRLDHPRAAVAGMLCRQSQITRETLRAFTLAAAPIARELYSCKADLPPDTELQELLAQHSGFGARVAGYLISLLIRLQKSSWRKHEQGTDMLRRRLEEGGPVLLSFWHGKYLPLFALLEGLHGCIFASCSFRGEVIAEICRRFGYECILIPEKARKRAVQIMAKAILHYGTGAVAADGPRGPERVFKLGSVQLSSELGMTVIPASVAVHPKLVSKKRWDRYETPLPFSHVYLLVGRGTAVPVGLHEGELDSWSVRLKKELDDTDSRARDLLTSLRGRGHGIRGIPGGSHAAVPAKRG